MMVNINQFKILMELQLLKFSKLFMFVEMRLFLLNYFF